ncbi:MAG TPA: hypothetical protein PLM24_00045 [Methanothrix sp.]|nr:hypothetical protein [Methanothrix sp.]HPR65506.1 hypothetical protein [Methanothrix sp.]
MQRAMVLLASACPEVPADSLARLSIGERDGLLLTLREWAFGPHLIGMTACPECGDRLELNFDTADVRATPENESDEEFSIAVSDYDLRFRLVNTQDLSTIDGGDVAFARQMLLNRCILAVRYRGEESSIDQLPFDVVGELVEQMGLLDPQADVQLALTCPSCTNQWEAAFDIVSFFWAEIESWAHRLLREVHSLARAYGWRESDILAMSPQRRQLYLELIEE